MSCTKFFALVALALPTLIVADGRKVNETNCINGNVTVMNNFAPVPLCFKNIVQEHISKKTSGDGCHTAEDFNIKFENFRHSAIDSCITKEGRTPFKNRPKYLYDIVAYSLSNDTFRDFYNNNGTECVQRLKNDLIACVSDNTGLNMTSVTNETNINMSNPKYWLTLNKLKYTNGSCLTTEDIKTCVVGHIQTKCTEPISKYIINMFDHILKKCDGITKVSSPDISNNTIQVSPGTGKSWASKVAAGPIIIMGTMLMLFMN